MKKTIIFIKQEYLFLLKAIFTLSAWGALIILGFSLCISCATVKPGANAMIFHPTKVVTVSESDCVSVRRHNQILKDIAFAIDDSEDALEYLVADIENGIIDLETGQLYKSHLEAEIKHLKDTYNDLSLEYYNQHESTP